MSAKKQSYTPGPWRSGTMTMDAKEWAGLNKRKHPLDIVQRGQDVIAAVWCGDDAAGEEAANARLISLAPEMAKALANLVGQCVQGAEFHGITANSPSAKDAIATANAILAKINGDA